MNELDYNRIKQIARREAGIVLMVAALLVMGVIVVAAWMDGKMAYRIEVLEKSIKANQ